MPLDHPERAHIAGYLPTGGTGNGCHDVNVFEELHLVALAGMAGLGDQHPLLGAEAGQAPGVAPALEAAGVPIAGRVQAPALADGGDMFWLDERTLLTGCGYRTNEAGIARLRELLPNVDVIAYDLPHWRGRREVMHLMSLISPLAPDLAVVYAPF